MYSLRLRCGLRPKSVRQAIHLKPIVNDCWRYHLKAIQKARLNVSPISNELSNSHHLFHLYPSSRRSLLMAAMAVFVCFYGYYRRWKLCKRQEATGVTNWPARLKTLADQVLAIAASAAGLIRRMHVLIFYALERFSSDLHSCGRALWCVDLR